MSILDLRTSHAALLAGEKGSLWGELVIEGPQPPKSSKSTPRPPVDLVIVVDRSGSMRSGGQIHYQPVMQSVPAPPAPVWYQAPGYVAPHPFDPQPFVPRPWERPFAPRRKAVVGGYQPISTGSAFDHAREAAQQALSQLGPEDRSAVVVYDGRVDVLAGLSSAHRSNGQTLDGVAPRGSTDLAGGLFAGVDQLAKADPTRQRRVFLLSDGNANVGLTDPDAIASEVRRFADQGIVVSTFGLGRDYNEDLLQAIAEAGGGGYYYLPTADEAPAAFREELAEVFRPSLAQVEVTVKPAVGVKLAGKYGAGSELERRKVKLGDVPAGAQRKLFLNLELAKKHAASADELALAEVKIRYKRHGETKWRELAAAVNVQVTKDEDAVMGGVDHEVLAQVAAFEAAHHQAEAAKMAEQGDVDGARTLLRNASVNMSNLAAEGFGGEQLQSSLAQATQYESLLAAGQFDAGTAKSMKYTAYRTRSSR